MNFAAFLFPPLLQVNLQQCQASLKVWSHCLCNLIWRRCWCRAFWRLLDVTATPCGSCMSLPVEVLLPAENRRKRHFYCSRSVIIHLNRSRWDTRWWPMNWQPVTGASACQFCRPLLCLSAWTAECVFVHVSIVNKAWMCCFVLCHFSACVRLAELLINTH